MARTTDPILDAYRKRLTSAARSLPRKDRHDLIEAVEEHLAAGAREGASEVDIRNMLEELGDPEEIVESARPTQERRLGLIEVGAVVLLLAGAFLIPVVGWVIGVALLWSSTAWRLTQKWLGTLVVPGGLAAPLVLAWYGPGRTDCSAIPAGSAPAVIPPPPGAGGPLDAAVHIETNVGMCSTSPVFAGWLGLIVSVVLVLATVAVAVHLLRSAQLPRSDAT